MPFQKGQSGHPGRSPNEKVFADALRAALNAEDPKRKRGKLLAVIDSLVEQAMDGESWAIQMVADRLDGKAVQETQLTVNKHAATDYTRDELVTLIHDTVARGEGAAAEDGRGGQADQLH